MILTVVSNYEVKTLILHLYSSSIKFSLIILMIIFFVYNQMILLLSENWLHHLLPRHLICFSSCFPSLQRIPTNFVGLCTCHYTIIVFMLSWYFTIMESFSELVVNVLSSPENNFLHYFINCTFLLKKHFK